MILDRGSVALAFALLGLAGCQPTSPPEPEEPAADRGEDFVAPIERAHSIESWKQKQVLQSGIVVRFGGNIILEGRMLTTPSMSRTRLDLESGAVSIWDGEDVWVTPADADFPRARFHALTWPYFLLAPIKLRDPGALVAPIGEQLLRGERFETAKLTFESGVGDTPDDWYVLYRNPETGRLAAMAYIVTFGTSQEEAEKEPHAVTYDEYTDVEGVPIATRWTFWMWNEGEGIQGEPIGEMTLQDPAFVAPPEDAFTIPEGARKEALPAG